LQPKTLREHLKLSRRASAKPQVLLHQISSDRDAVAALQLLRRSQKLHQLLHPNSTPVATPLSFHVNTIDRS
jgi:hypothetical protein